MGHTRAYAYVRGAPLPPGGSFQERMLSETILRERNEKYTLVSMFVRILSHMGNLPSEAIDSILEVYREELYQFRYNSEYVTGREKRVKKAKADAVAQEEMIARQFRRLEDMTVTDDDMVNEDD